MKISPRFFIALAAIFLLNDLAFIRIKSYQTWLAVDYASRVLAVLIIIYLLKSGKAALSDFGFTKMRLKPFILWAILLSITGIAIDQFGWNFFKSILPPTGLAHFPKIENNFVKMFDLFIGMALVGVSEEAIFRGYFFSVFKDRLNPAALVAFSSVIFGLIHWSSGLHAVITTALWGILPMVSVIRNKSILPSVIGHYMTDFIYFFQ